MSRKGSRSCPLHIVTLCSGKWEIERVYSHMTMQIYTRRVTGVQREDSPVRKEIVMSAAWKIEAYRTTASCWGVGEGLGMGHLLFGLSPLPINGSRLWGSRRLRHKLWRAMSSFLGDRDVALRASRGITCDLCSIWPIQALFWRGLDMGGSPPSGRKLVEQTTPFQPSA
jgi:hypothetical protein